MNKPYWENRKEKIITEGYGSYKMSIRYMANSNMAQVTVEDTSKFRLQLIWSRPMTDEQANAALEIFKSIGFFEVA